MTLPKTASYSLGSYCRSSQRLNNTVMLTEATVKVWGEVVSGCSSFRSCLLPGPVLSLITHLDRHLPWESCRALPCLVKCPVMGRRKNDKGANYLLLLLSYFFSSFSSSLLPFFCKHIHLLLLPFPIFLNSIQLVSSYFLKCFHLLSPLFTISVLVFNIFI